MLRRQNGGAGFLLASAAAGWYNANPMTEKKKKKKLEFYSGTGRRKRAVARVWLYPKEGELIVNEQPIAKYFADLVYPEGAYLRPLQLSEAVGKFSASIKIAGGGKSAQLGAVVHGLARALVKANPQNRSSLKKEGLLTRDSRETERKKYFLRKARKRPQYSKR